MSELESILKTELADLGADIVGFGSLEALPESARAGLPIGVSVAVVYPREVIKGIYEYPTQEYVKWYGLLNERLDAIVSRGAEILQEKGFEAIAQTREYVGSGEILDVTTLPHKTVATRAGIGWIGKCALLVNEKYGSAIRLSSIMTNAPLSTALPVETSRCGDCRECTDACPGGAVSGKPWAAGVYRDEFFDSIKCRKTAQERTKKNLGLELTVCGKCIEICPHTQRYLQSE